MVGAGDRKGRWLVGRCYIPGKNHSELGETGRMDGVVGWYLLGMTHFMRERGRRVDMVDSIFQECTSGLGM